VLVPRVKQKWLETLKQFIISIQGLAKAKEGGTKVEHWRPRLTKNVEHEGVGDGDAVSLVRDAEHGLNASLYEAE